MALKGEDGKQYLVMIKPLFQEDQNTFSTALLYLDKELLLPTQIYLLAPDGKSSKNFKLSRIRANQLVDPQYFVGARFGKLWKVERNPDGAMAADPGPATQKAIRGRSLGQPRRQAMAPNDDQPR